MRHRSTIDQAVTNVVQRHIHDRALFLILVECVKRHKAKEASRLGPYNYIIKQSMELPRFHTVDERLSNGGHILPEYIHPFWWYKRPESSTPLAIDVQVRLMILNPAVVRRKGRLRGAKGKKAYGHGVTGMMNSFSSNVSIKRFRNRKRGCLFA